MLSSIKGQVTRPTNNHPFVRLKVLHFVCICTTAVNSTTSVPICYYNAYFAFSFRAVIYIIYLPLGGFTGCDDNMSQKNFSKDD